MNPDFSVPAEFFYALAVNSPGMSAADQLTYATSRRETQLYAQFLLAIDAGTIEATPQGISPLQAVRRLTALGAARAIAPRYTVGPAVGPPPQPAAAQVYDLVGAVAPTESWLSDTGPLPPAELDTTAADAALWQTLLAGGPPATANQQAQLRLVVCALTGWDDPQLSQFIAQLATLLSVGNADDLASLTQAQWRSFFAAPGNTALLPPFTQPPSQTVSVSDRIEAFLRFLTQFYTVAPSAGTVASPVAGPVPLLDRYGFDPLQSFLVAYDTANPGTPFAFGTSAPDDAAAQAAIAAVFPGPAGSEAAAWLADALKILTALAEVTSGLIPAASPNAAALTFSIMEALWARGFASQAQIAELDEPDFASALTGSVAYQWAQQIWTKAGGTLQPQPPPPEQFQPVNSGGSLTNCLPPPELSPLGPVSYLSEMLKVGPASTCAVPEVTGDTFAALLAGRRGDLASLEATRANLAVPLPALDLVNECLENIAGQVAAGGGSASSASGIVRDTSGDKVGDHLLRAPGTEPEPGLPFHHDPTVLLAAVAEHSSPASPVAEPTGYALLSTDFSAPELPYSQSLDVARSYLREAGTTRFETMRRLRAQITEFALGPDPAGFDPAVWRYPVRSDIAPEYLAIGPDEYRLLYATPIATTPPGNPGQLLLWQMYGYTDATLPGGQPWEQSVVVLGEFLRRTGLSYCEFYELWQSGIVPFQPGGRDTTGTSGDPAGTGTGDPSGTGTPEPAGTGTGDPVQAGFDLCEPCCLDTVIITFGPNADTDQALLELAVVIRLWRTVRDVPGAGYSLTELADIATVLGLFDAGAVNPGFIAQLAAFQMLRDQFGLPLGGSSQPGLTGAQRTRLLGLWAGTAAPDACAWATGELLSRLEAVARREHDWEQRPGMLEAAAANLDQLSVLGGFDPGNPPDTWNAAPTHTLRFAEILAKLYASPFTVGDIEFLFTAGTHLPEEDPFPLPDADDASSHPLALPARRPHSLEVLRRRLIDADVDDEEAERWNWWRIESVLRSQFGYNPPADADPLVSLAQHAFPDVLERHGHPVTPASRQYRTALATTDTSSSTWNSDPESPLRYDPAANNGELWTRLPLPDGAVLETLTRTQQLTSTEQAAVQDLYLMPRRDLAALGFLFPNLAAADRELLQEGDEHGRWAYFRRHVALAHRRGQIIAEFLAENVAGAEPDEHDVRRASLVLRELSADENFATSSWEGGQPAGTPPALTWPAPAGGAYTALLGLCGTGLLAEYRDESGTVVWRDYSGSLREFGWTRDRWNAPLPTLIPSLGTPASPAGYAEIRNGIAVAASDGRRLGGAQGFTVAWTGVLLVERGGRHRFSAGAPTPEGEHPDAEAARRARWNVTLQRDSRTWVLLSHGWTGQSDTGHTTEHELHDGAYDITISFESPAPDFSRRDLLHRLRTGFEVKYAGPDTDDELISLPHHRLFTRSKNAPLSDGVAEAGGPAVAAALEARYPSTLRDIRRTYQRAFKAVMLAARFGLRAQAGEDEQSELGYFLGHPDQFAGMSFFRDPPPAGGFAPHQAQFDLNFLPVLDTYDPPGESSDQRVAPHSQRQAAMFDWWERLFDYTIARRRNHQDGGPALWWLFQAASEMAPGDPAPIRPYLDVEPGHVDLVQTFNGLQALLGRPELTAQDLLNERWAIRAWRAEAWAREVDARGGEKGLAATQPAAWAADDPGAGTPSGNDGLTAFVQDALIENGEPRRYADLQRLDDGLRERARSALLAFLSRMNRVELPVLPAGTFASSPSQLTDLLLLDVACGICERATRIDDAISAVQAFVLRCRLGLEPGVSLSPAFRELWDGRFATFRVWQACKRRELYPENWIEWVELDKARRHEGFRFLEQNLRSADLSVPVPAGEEYWDDPRPRRHPGLPVLQAATPSTLHLPIPASAQPGDAAVPTENFGLLGRPDWSGSPSWLAAIGTPPPTAPPPPPPPPGTTAPPGSARSSPGRKRSADSPAAPAAVLADAAVAVDSLPVPPVPGGQGQPGRLPLWIEAAVRLGARFLRVAAAGEPAGSSLLEPLPDEGGCCADCGRIHPPVMDEYYFWLAAAGFYDLPAAQDGDTFNANGESSWDDPALFPELLSWGAQPMVHLYWCRVHCGEFGQLRRSADGVMLDPGMLGDPPAPPTLELRGRMADSLVFAVSGGLVPVSLGGSGFAWQPPYQGWNSEPGWRYDLADDEAEVLPLVATPPPVNLLPTSLPAPRLFAGLAAYPFFVYFGRGASLVPLSSFGPAVAVAGALRGHCRFEAALRWYGMYYDAQQGDSTWCQAQAQAQANLAGTTSDSPGSVPRGGPPASQGPCCDSASPPPAVARRRSILLDTLETLLSWGDAVAGRHRGCALDGGGAPEAFAQARVIFDAAARILGADPITTVLSDSPPPPQVVGQFQPLPAPLNPRLMALYERIADRRRLIHECDNRSRLRYGQPGAGMSYWGDDPARDGWRTTTRRCCDPDHWCDPRSPYRFTFLLQRAMELAGEVQSFGSALLSALEKGDAEYLASLRATQEHQLLQLGLTARKDQYRDADWQVQALGQALLSAQKQLSYFTGLVEGGLNSGESIYQDLMGISLPLEVTAQVMELIANLGGVIPDTYVGTMDFAKIPMTGSSFATFFSAIAKSASYAAQDAQAGAALSLTEGGWSRRDAEWRHQMDIYSIEIEQIRRQILGAERRADAAQHDLNVQQRQIESSAQTDDFLRGKFTSHGLYLIYQRKCAIMYRQLYELAIETARQAEHAFNYERGHTAERFIDPDPWNSLRDGLLAGERLQVELHRMGKVYLDRDRREYELTKHISLRLHAPEQYLRLRRTGHCEFDLPEWFFDLDHPGHHMRRIKSVALSLPCVVGPYTGVHGRLTLLASSTRVDPRLTEPPHECCDIEGDRCGCDRLGYRPLPEDTRIVREYLARDAIATSSGRADSGMFEVNFGDNRYLPFEFAGAVCRMRLELPPENNFFDLDSLTDVIVHLSYTAREGGDALRRASAEAAECHLPGDGSRVFDVRNELSESLRRACRPRWPRHDEDDDDRDRDRDEERDRPHDHEHKRNGDPHQDWDKDRDREWHRDHERARDWDEDRDQERDDERHAERDRPWQLDLRLTRNLFPFLPGRRELTIEGVQVIFETPDASPGRYRILRLEQPGFRDWQAEHDDHPPGDGVEILCVATERWPGCYTGFIPREAVIHRDQRVGPGDPADLGVLLFPDDLDDLGEVFLLCRYDAAREAHRDKRERGGR